MKNKFLKLITVALCALSLNVSFSSVPAASSSVVQVSDTTEVDQKIDQLTVDDISHIDFMRALIKINPERVLDHCAGLALQDFDKNNQMIDVRWLDFFVTKTFSEIQNLKNISSNIMKSILR